MKGSHRLHLKHCIVNKDCVATLLDPAYFGPFKTPEQRKKTHKKEENPTQKKLKIEFQNTFICQ